MVSYLSSRNVVLSWVNWVFSGWLGLMNCGRKVVKIRIVFGLFVVIRNFWCFRC